MNATLTEYESLSIRTINTLRDVGIVTAADVRRERGKIAAMEIRNLGRAALAELREAGLIEA